MLGKSAQNEYMMRLVLLSEQLHGARIFCPAGVRRAVTDGNSELIRFRAAFNLYYVNTNVNIYQAQMERHMYIRPNLL